MKRMLIILLLMMQCVYAQQIIYYPRVSKSSTYVPESTYVATVTRGDVSFASNKDTVSSYQETVDLSKTLVWMQESISNTNLMSAVQVALNVQSNRLFFRRDANDQTINPTISWKKVVKTRGWKIAHIDTTFTWAQQLKSMTIKLPWKIDSTKTYVVFSGYNYFNNWATHHSQGTQNLFPTDSTVSFKWWSEIGDGRFSIQVVEDSNCSVKRYYSYEPFTSESDLKNTITITSSAVNKTLLLPFYTFINGPTTYDSIGGSMIDYHQTSATNIYEERGVPQYSIWYRCLQVVTFTDNTIVDTLNASFTTSQTSVTVSHSTADYDISCIIGEGSFRNTSGYGAVLERPHGIIYVRSEPIDDQSFSAIRGYTGSRAINARFRLIRYNTKELIP